MTSIRDFIYLDVDRLKSILAQMEEGFIEEVAKGTQTSRTVEGRAEPAPLSK